MVGTFLASTPLLKEAWRLCSITNAMGHGAFVVEQVGGVGYVAFSGTQEIPVLGLDPDHSMLAPLDAADNGLFALLKRSYDGEKPVVVHSGVLHLFHSFHSRPDFQSQIDSLLHKTKSIVITGHSVGGSIASLTALWLLSYLKSIFSPLSVLCIGFGSLFLDNESLSQVILRERWGGSFCNVMSMHDVMPRLSLDQSLVQTSQWKALMRFWYTSMMSPNSMNFANLQLTEEDKARFFSFVATSIEHLAQVGEGSRGRSFWPFGNYLFCSDEGAICLDKAISVNEMMHVMLRLGSPNCIIEEHLKYGQYVERLTYHSLKRSFMEGDLSESSYEASLSMALNSSRTSPQIGTWCNSSEFRSPLILYFAAIRLSKITPYRVEIEWYKACCDKSNEQSGYYDSFKQRGASKRESKINMNRFKLATFWDDVILMLDRKELPHDLHKRSKWVEASRFYMLLVEPLDIAEYYRSGMHLKKGHYISKGRARRYKIFYQWWTERVVTEKLGNRRTRHASLTQDTCFWARVEEAKEWLDKIRRESDPANLASLWDRLNEFKTYAMKKVEGLEVSADVVAKNSSFSLWLEEWRAYLWARGKQLTIAKHWIQSIESYLSVLCIDVPSRSLKTISRHQTPTKALSYLNNLLKHYQTGRSTCLAQVKRPRLEILLFHDHPRKYRNCISSDPSYRAYGSYEVKISFTFNIGIPSRMLMAAQSHTALDGTLCFGCTFRHTDEMGCPCLFENAFTWREP
ncbi:hypothetical protein BT93_H1304 [Corymbia citriodora subsp. variegata]|nr:hypothetical protein BT93_H1304 [Corymbia citriodora subsp. variegata]